MPPTVEVVNQWCRRCGMDTPHRKYVFFQPGGPIYSYKCERHPTGGASGTTAREVLVVLAVALVRLTIAAVLVVIVVRSWAR